LPVLNTFIQDLLSLLLNLKQCCCCLPGEFLHLNVFSRNRHSYIANQQNVN
jgi:hypothetical protein